MELAKRKKLSTIIAIAYSVLMIATFVMYFLPYWSFPIIKTRLVGEGYDAEAQTCTIEFYVEESQNSLAGFLWFPASSAAGHHTDVGSLRIRYGLEKDMEYEGYTLLYRNADEFVAGVDYFENTEKYIEFEYGAKYGTTLGINNMVTWSVIHMLMLLAFGITCVCTLKNPHFCYMAIVTGIVGVIGYLTSFSLGLGNNMLYVIMSALIAIVGCANIYFSIANIKDYLARRRELLIKMGIIQE